MSCDFQAYDLFRVPCSNAGQGSQCRPVGLGRHVGPSAIPRKYPAIILGTESHGGNSKDHNYPRRQDYSLYYEAHERILQPPQKTTWQAAQPSSRPAI